MLIPFEQVYMEESWGKVKEREEGVVYINPIYVKELAQHRLAENRTAITMVSGYMTVKGQVNEVAAKLNAAMPKDCVAAEAISAANKYLEDRRRQQEG